MLTRNICLALRDKEWPISLTAFSNIPKGNALGLRECCVSVLQITEFLHGTWCAETARKGAIGKGMEGVSYEGLHANCLQGSLPLEDELLGQGNRKG